MFRKKLHTFLTVACLSAGALSASENFGVVNFSTCVTDSKLGKEEQNNFENLKKQLGTHLEDTEKQINELAAKFNDPEFMDGLSPEAENEMKHKIQALNEEMGRYQNQYYQVLNQANMRIVQILSSNINTASEKIAKDKKLAMVINKDACFFFTPGLDVTNLVIAEMDKSYEQDAKKAAANAPQQPVQAVPTSNTEEKAK